MNAPALEIEILGADPVAGAAAPTMRFRMRATEPEGEREIYTVALNIQINFEPAKRSYDHQTREKLEELFGEPARWGATTQPFLWSTETAQLPSFTGSTEFFVDVACTYDLEVSSAKYFHALPDGDAPLAFHFSGMVFFCGEHDRVQLSQVSWDTSETFRLPAQTWRRMITSQYSNRGWVALGGDTLDALHRFRAARGLHSADAAVAELLEAARLEAPQ